ncbi:hypothetical protein [Methylobacterium planeticum]|uniref:Uncharacterized protein n=1 Tax=Methylobacterium planeticum TaxID=2615211 RepID=A0A6N6MMN7_9HYPH|nr:hypothetical protein [Methylobacterium planeticum]KAB1070313.1 hypothetical protein F6X51_23155 [Methylobacterium planeticum]
MSFDIVFTQSARIAATVVGDLPSLEERTRRELADLPGDGLSALEERLFHAFATEAGQECICTLLAGHVVQVDVCGVSAS